MIQIFDNFLDAEEEFTFVRDSCTWAKYSFGEQDRPETYPTGLVCNLNQDGELWRIIENKINNKIDRVKNKEIYRMYINCFSPSENPYFHTDAESGYTLLYYPTMPDWNLDEGGETQFIVNEEIKGVLPIPNRMILFDARMLHRATSFRSKHRFTLVVKYNDY